MASQSLHQVSYQTQLLALNALFEAARAGDAALAKPLDAVDVMAESMRHRAGVTVIDLDQMEDLQRCYQAVLHAAGN